MKFSNMAGAVALCCGMISPALAEDLTFTGELNLLSDLASFEFSPLAGPVTLWTDSFDPGFDPVLSLFKREGSDWLFIDQNDDHTLDLNFASDSFPSKPGQDSGDSMMQFQTLSAGVYRLYVSAYDNSPAAGPGGFLSEGWAYDATNQKPVDGGVGYRVHLDNVTPVPEPATWGLMLAGLAGVGFLRRRA